MEIITRGKENFDFNNEERILGAEGERIGE